MDSVFAQNTFHEKTRVIPTWLYPFQTPIHSHNGSHQCGQRYVTALIFDAKLRATQSYQCRNKRNFKSVVIVTENILLAKKNY